MKQISYSVCRHENLNTDSEFDINTAVPIIDVHESVIIKPDKQIMENTSEKDIKVEITNGKITRTLFYY